jgi:hypothetical protein
MIRHSLIAGFALFLLGLPFVASAEEQTAVSKQDTTTSTSKDMPAFPPSTNCTNSSPCRHVMGEITRIEESYWIKQPNGNEMHLKATKDSRLETLPKVGDKIAVQATSTGNVEALKMIEEFPKKEKMEVPATTLSDLR